MRLLSSSRQCVRRTLMSLIVLMMAGQAMAVTYSVSPTGWTLKPSSSITVNGTTYIAATQGDNSIYISIKAEVNSDNSVIFYAKKSSGTFENKASVLLYKDLNGSNQKLVASGSISAGSSQGTLSSFTPDFTSGSYKYTALLLSNGIYFCTAPITIKANNVTAPSIIALASSDVTSSSATLSAYINPNGDDTRYRFLWGTSESDLNNSSGYYYLDASTTATFVEYEVTGLSPNTTYYYRLVATNSVEPTWSSTKSFTTTGVSKPSVMTYNAINVTSNSATLKGSINPNGTTASYVFWWGTDPNSMTNHHDLVSLPAGTSYVDVEYNLTGLSPNQTYYFNLSATNIAGGGSGETRAFTTLDGGSGGGCTFPDLKSGDQFYDETCYLYDLGVISGSDQNGYMQVNNYITRGQLAKVAFRGVYSIKDRDVDDANVPSDNFPTVFSDLVASSDYSRPARALIYLEYGDGISPFNRDTIYFNPSNTITRLHTLKVLMETFNIKPNVTGSNNPFPSDADVVSLASKNPVMMGYIREAARLGIITTSNSTFKP